MKTKGVILSILALVLVVGAPAAIAWADADESVSLSEIETDPAAATVTSTIQYWIDGNKHQVTATSEDRVGPMDSMLFSMPDPEVRGLTLLSTKTMMQLLVESAAFGLDVGVSTASVEKIEAVFYDVDDGGWHRLMRLDLTDGPHVLTAAERLLLKTADNMNVSILLNGPVGDSFVLSFQPHTHSTGELISDNAVETILIVAGILLIVCAIYATPWVRVGSATAAAEAAYRAGRRAAIRAMRSAEASRARRAANRRSKR